MNFTKTLTLTFLIILLQNFHASGQFNLFKYGFIEYHDIKWMTEYFVPHGILNNNFKHRLVIPNFREDSLVLLHQNNIVTYTQNLGKDEYLENRFYPENTYISGTENGRTFIIRKMKIVEFSENSILFKAKTKNQLEKAQWIEFELNKSDLSGIYIGNSWTDMPLVIVGSLVGIIIVAIIEDYLGDDY